MPAEMPWKGLTLEQTRAAKEQGFSRQDFLYRLHQKGMTYEETMLDTPSRGLGPERIKDKNLYSMKIQLVDQWSTEHVAFLLAIGHRMYWCVFFLKSEKIELLPKDAWTLTHEQEKFVRTKLIDHLYEKEMNEDEEDFYAED